MAELGDDFAVGGAVGAGVLADVLPLDCALLVDDEGCGGGQVVLVQVEYAVGIGGLGVGVG